MRLWPLACLTMIFAQNAHGQDLDLSSFGISDLLKRQAEDSLSCVQIASAVTARIGALDERLKVFITVNPKLAETARALDAARVSGAPLGPLHCVPLAVKDNFNTFDMPTSGGSVLLRDSRPSEDSFAVARLRAAGALIIGKTNLDELAVAGSTISSIRGQTLNPYDQSRFAAGSSGGSAVAVSTGIATVAIGTETVNSLRNAANSAGVVAIRPTRGLVSRTGVIPLSTTMDVVGSFGRTVADAAILLRVLSGRDPLDPWTTSVEAIRSDSFGKVVPAELRGKRIGVLRNLFGRSPEHAPVNAVMADALNRLRSAGAEIVDIDDTRFDSEKSYEDLNVNNYEFKPLFERYLAQLGPKAPIKTVREYVDADKYPPTMRSYLANAVKWQAPLEMQEYLQKLAAIADMRKFVLDLFESKKLDVLAYPMQKRASLRLTDTPKPERNGIFASALGFPAIDLPAGMTAPDATAPDGVPVGIDLIGRPFDDEALQAIAAGFERVIAGRRPPRVGP